MGRRKAPDETPAVRALRSWLDLRGMSQTALADALGVHVQLVYGWTGARMRPSYELAAAIDRLSGGLVPIALWADSGQAAQIAEAAAEKIDKKSA